jgi:hypothetical protein
VCVVQEEDDYSCFLKYFFIFKKLFLTSEFFVIIFFDIIVQGKNLNSGKRQFITSQLNFFLLSCKRTLG